MRDYLSVTTREEFQRLLQEDLGSWVLYTRSDRRFRCRDCWEPDKRSGRPDCGTCFGTGHQTTLEPWLVFWSNSLKRPQEVEPPLTRAGWLPDHDPVVFSRWNDQAVVGDRFFIVEWDRDDVPAGARPTRLVQAFQVAFVDPFLIKRVVYYVNHLNYVSESLNLYQSALLRAPIAPVPRWS